MKAGSSAYIALAAVDADHQVIVAIGVSNQASDAVHLIPMLERIGANTGQLPDALIADAGYCSTANLEAYEELRSTPTSRRADSSTGIGPDHRGGVRLETSMPGD